MHVLIVVDLQIPMKVSRDCTRPEPIKYKQIGDNGSKAQHIEAREIDDYVNESLRITLSTRKGRLMSFA